MKKFIISLAILLSVNTVQAHLNHENLHLNLIKLQYEKFSNELDKEKVDSYREILLTNITFLENYIIGNKAKLTQKIEAYKSKIMDSETSIKYEKKISIAEKYLKNLNEVQFYIQDMKSKL